MFRWFTKYSSENTVYMRYRSLTIGTAPGSHVQLRKVSHCPYISNKHATIFYDDVSLPPFHRKKGDRTSSLFQVTQTYELLNYSEFGTEVNGQWYTCDFTEHVPPRPAQIKEPKEWYDSVRAIIDKRRNIVRTEVKNGEMARLVRCHFPPMFLVFLSRFLAFLLY